MSDNQRYKEQGERLKELRNALGFIKDQEGFSQVLQIKRGSYSTVESGRQGISANMLNSLLSYRDDININWLLSGEGEMFLKVIDPKASKEAIKNEKYLVTDDEYEELRKLIARLAQEVLTTREETRDRDEKIKLLEKELEKYKSS